MKRFKDIIFGASFSAVVLLTFIALLVGWQRMDRIAAEMQVAQAAEQAIQWYWDALYAGEPVLDALYAQEDPEAEMNLKRITQEFNARHYAPLRKADLRVLWVSVAPSVQHIEFPRRDLARVKLSAAVAYFTEERDGSRILTKLNPTYELTLRKEARHGEGDERAWRIVELVAHDWP